MTLVYDNGEGLEFRRTIAVDDKYLFTIKDEVVEQGRGAGHALSVCADLASRHAGDARLLHPARRLDRRVRRQGPAGGDLLRRREEEDHLVHRRQFLARLHRQVLGRDPHFPTTKLQIDAKFAAGPDRHPRPTRATISIPRSDHRAGRAPARPTRGCSPAPRKSSIVDGYNEKLGLNKFDRLIDWGCFYFITKPLFLAMDWIYQKVGNFGLAILIITVLIKIVFFPLANKSYASMAKMKAVQPEMMAIRERYADDKMKQQQAMMELYKKEKINPIAGCLPILVQIPVFFALYKVLFVTIDLRHAPFFGWIKDLSAPDPTTIFNLFGLLPWDPSIVPVIGPFLMLGLWPLIMGVTMWFQMKLNPPPPDPTQKMIFDYMPIIFTFMLASFSAGLVIYWAWNNTLSVLQQSVIMHKHGAKIELWDNLKGLGDGVKGLSRAHGTA